MKDTYGVEIKVGDLVKRSGKVMYADGLKFKISKKTWKVSKIENNELYYTDENGNDVKLNIPAVEGGFLVVTEDVFQPVQGVKAGGVPQKYRVHGDVKDKNWKDGDIVQIFGQVSKETIDSGKLEKVPDSVEHKHVLIVADVIKLFGNQN